MLHRLAILAALVTLGASCRKLPHRKPDPTNKARDQAEALQIEDAEDLRGMLEDPNLSAEERAGYEAELEELAREMGRE